MDTSQPLALLGGLTPALFMKRHWQKKPLLVRNAVPGMTPLVQRDALFQLASRDDVESRLVMQDADAWRMRRGPFTRRALPALSRPAWTLLVQGVDLHDGSAHALLQQFGFIPRARMDDLMVSYASEGGGVGPHFDSYDVFLLQVQGQRRWRYGRQRDLSLRDDVPLKILASFEPEHDEVLEPGDMLYLPPRYAHDGVAVGECQTYSIGFRSPSLSELAREVLSRLAEDAGDAVGDALYADPKQEASGTPGAVPAALTEFAAKAVRDALQDPRSLDRALGEYLTEPKQDVWFDAGSLPRKLGALVLDARTRMLYDAVHVFVNGESWRAAGRDAKLMQVLADRRRLDAAQVQGASADAQSLLASWCKAGWAHLERTQR